MMDNHEIHRKALKRFREAWDFDERNRGKGKEDLRFQTGEGQWDPAAQAEREAAHKPVLTINRMPQFVRQVTGDIRKTNPSIKVIPGDTEASKPIAKIYEGLIRAIEYCSMASSVYERAGENAAQCGIGNFRVDTKYMEGDTFDQEIYLENIPDAFSVTWDPQARHPNRIDARFVFVSSWVDHEEYEERFPGKTMSDFDVPEDRANWVIGDRVRITEYIWIETEHKTIYRLYDGTVTDQKPEKKGKDNGYDLSRKAEVRKVFSAILSGRELLTDPEPLLCKYLPIVAITGEEIHDGEDVVRSSVIRYAKDSQRVYNYWRSIQMEMIALQPKAPYMVTPREIEGFESVWRTANLKSLPYLPFNPDPGVNRTRPQRINPPSGSAGMMQEIMLAAEDMKATTGIYDAGLGARGNEVSGIAISRRQEEGDVSTSIYVDNTASAVEHAGRIIVDLIPKIYDGERVVRIIDVDGEEDTAVVNEMFNAGPDPAGNPIYKVKNDLSAGKYNVRVKTGPSYTTRRQEGAAMMIEFVKAVPKVGEIAFDIIAKAQDWEGADELSERLKKALPPGLADEPKAEEGEEGAPNPQAEMMAQQKQAAEIQMQAQQQAMAADVAKKTAEAQKAQATAKEAQARAIEAETRAEEARLKLEATRISLEREKILLQQSKEDLLKKAREARAPLKAPATAGD